MGVYRDKKDGFYYIDFYVGSKRIRQKIGTSKKLAEQVLRKRKVAVAEKRFLDIKKESKVKFETLAGEYIEKHAKPYKKSWKKSDVISRKHLSSFFAGKSLHEITARSIEDYKLERMEKVAPATVNRELACLKHMFSKAIEWGMADSNPARKVKLFKEDNARVRFLEKEEIVTLIKNCKEPLRSIVIVALNTGMRKGEIFNLKWRDLDFKRDIIYLEETKSGERRQIPMNTATRATLIAVEKNLKSPYIFCGSNDKMMTPSAIRKSFLKTLTKSDILEFRFHDLRHTFASHLVMGGVDLNTVRELLGHKSLDMTLRYSHLSPDHKKSAVEVLGFQVDSYMDSKPKIEAGVEKLFLHNSLRGK